MKDSLVIIGFCLVIIAILLYPSKEVQYGHIELHVVEPTETLWSIAEKYNPKMDPREVIQRIKEINQCSSLIYAGQELEVPVWE